MTMCHLKAKRGFEALRKQQMATLHASLSAYLALLSDPPSLVAVMGDFNAQATEPCAELLQKQGFSSLFSSKHYPWTTWKRRYSKQDGQQVVEESKARIDHIFVRPAPRLMSYLALPSSDKLEEHALPCKHYPSDHISVAARFQY